MLGESGLQEYTYDSIAKKKVVNFDVVNGWLGITDKYWAAVLVPDTSAHLKARFSTGAIGNLLDRIRSHEGVVDFLDVGLRDLRWPVFNVADVAVTVGAILLALSLWKEEQPRSGP